MNILSKSLLCFFILATSIFLVSCEGDGVKGSADATMTTFIEKIKAHDFDTAQVFATDATDGTLRFLKKNAVMQKEMGKEFQLFFAGIDFSQVSKAECTTSDKTATCKCCEETTGNCAEIKVILEGNKWLVDVPQERTVGE